MLQVAGSSPLVVQSGKTVKLDRSLDRPVRYFLAKQSEGPMLIVASRIDTVNEWLDKEGLGAQFHPSYTGMVPAHHVVELQLIGCPDPDPVYTRFFTPLIGTLPSDLVQIGELDSDALAEEISQWLDRMPGE